MYAYTQYLYNLRGREEIERERGEKCKNYLLLRSKAQTRKETLKQPDKQKRANYIHTYNDKL